MGTGDFLIRERREIQTDKVLNLLFLSRIKKHLRIATNETDEDELLQEYAEASEKLIEHMTDIFLNDCVFFYTFDVSQDSKEVFDLDAYPITVNII